MLCVQRNRAVHASYGSSHVISAFQSLALFRALHCHRSKETLIDQHVEVHNLAPAGNARFAKTSRPRFEACRSLAGAEEMTKFSRSQPPRSVMPKLKMGLNIQE